MILFYILLCICLIDWIGVVVISLKDDEDDEDDEDDKVNNLVWTTEYEYQYIKKKENKK